MLSSNPIWFREQQAWKARRARLPWWRRNLRYATLPLTWCGIAALSMGIAVFMPSSRRAEAPPWHEALGTGVVLSLYLQVAYVVFRSLIAGASALVRERELQTLDTLITSPMAAMDLLLGKWQTCAFPLLAESTLVLPLGICMVKLAGPHAIPAWILGDVYVLSGMLVLAMTGVGLLLSTQQRNSSRAAAQAVLVGLGLTLGTYLADLLVQLFTGESRLLPILCWLNPYTALWSLWVSAWPYAFADEAGRYGYPFNGEGIQGHLWQVSAAGYFLMACGAGWLAWLRLRGTSSV